MIRSLAVAASATFMLLSGSGLQGCIENPGPDVRLNRVSYEYRPVGRADFDHQTVLQISFKQDTIATWLRVTSLASMIIDSAAVFLQFGAPFRTQGSAMNYPNPRFRHIARFGRLAPGESLDLGPIAEKDLDLAKFTGKATLLRISTGAKRGHPMGGVYDGTYNLIDTSRTLYAGTLYGILDADGRFGFILTTGPIRGINGVLEGLLDQMRLDMGTLYTEPEGLRNSPQFERGGTPFSIQSGENGLPHMTGSFQPLGAREWLQSLDCELRSVDGFPD